MSNVILSITFRDKEFFTAETRAIRFLESAGFSIGRKQSHAPRGILYGDFDIQKWRNLSERDRAALHGALVTDAKDLNATFEIRDTLPHKLIIEFRSLISERFMDASETFICSTFPTLTDHSSAGDTRHA